MALNIGSEERGGEAAKKASSVVVSRVLRSPNRRVRRVDERLEFVIVHGTWMAGDGAALARLTDPAAEVSCHYYITRAGEVIQLVAEDEVAFHAGKSRAVNASGVEIDGLNGWSLGIEIANSGPFGGRVPTPLEEASPDWATVEPYSEAQYGAVVALLKDILARNAGIQPARVLGHNEVAPGRKSDPGPHFDWARLIAAGVAEGKK